MPVSTQAKCAETSQVNTKKGELGNWALFHEVGIQSDAFSELCTVPKA